MATSITKFLSQGFIGLSRLHARSGQACRGLLSQAYGCNEAWNEEHKAPIFLQVTDLADYALGLKDKSDKRGVISAIDIDILAHKLRDADEDHLDYVENLLRKFRSSPDALQPMPSTTYALIRSYMALDQSERMVNLIRNKSEYRIFPDEYATSHLMNQLIENQQYELAATIAYEFMLQEDFSAPVTRLLSLYACIKRLSQLDNEPESQKEEEATESPKAGEEEEEEEETWIPINYIKYPYYDDHFNIYEERLLLGKTFSMIGRTVGSQLGPSLELLGYGMYEKFERGLQMIEDHLLTADKKAPKIYKESLNRFSNTLSTMQTRDPEAPEVEMGVRRIQDERMLLLPIPEEKQTFIDRLQELSARLDSAGLLHDAEQSLESNVESYVESELPKYETEHINHQISLFSEWSEKRQELLDTQIHEYLREDTRVTIIQKLKDIREREELLTYFENKNLIDIAAYSITAGNTKKRMDKLAKMYQKREDFRNRKSRQT